MPEVFRALTNREFVETFNALPPDHCFYSTNSLCSSCVVAEVYAKFHDRPVEVGLFMAKPLDSESYEDNGVILPADQQRLIHTFDTIAKKPRSDNLGGYEYGKTPKSVFQLIIDRMNILR